MGGVYIQKNLLVNGNIVCGNDIDINGNLSIGRNIISNGNAIFGNVELNTISNVGILTANTIISNIIKGNTGVLNLTVANIDTLIGSNVEILNIFDFHGNNISFNKITITDEIIGSNIIANTITFSIIFTRDLLKSSITIKITIIIKIILVCLVFNSTLKFIFEFFFIILIYNIFFYFIA
jgi:hypothetical protein